MADPAGVTSTATAELNFVGVNDAPTTGTDWFTTREGITKTFYANDLLANDRDVEGDDFSFVGISSATGGTATLRTVEMNGEEVQVIDVVSNELGYAKFSYEVVDELGAASTGSVQVHIVPLP